MSINIFYIPPITPYYTRIGSMFRSQMVTFLMLNEDDGKLKSGYHVLPINSGAVTYDKSKWV